MNVAVDAMGGDHSPKIVVKGAVEAASELGIDITLVGNRNIIAKELDLTCSDHIQVHHCEEVVQMDESPSKAFFKKKDASIRVAFDLMKKGAVDAVVSAGNSGAILAAGILTSGRMEGVERPAIAGIFPSEKGPVTLIDVGANVDCRPSYLLQFGIMADAFAKSCLGIKNPKIGLLSIGKESGKGNELVRLAKSFFKESPLNFVGNVEGRDIFTGDVDIIVCDGFVGNVALKLSEGMGHTMVGFLKRELASSFFGRAALIFGHNALEKFKRKLNYEEYGGAPLLGINGVCIICHGASSSRAIKKAIDLAARYVNNRVLDKMALELNKFKR